MIRQMQHGGEFLWSCPEPIHKLFERLTGLVLVRVPRLDNSATYYLSSQYPLDPQDIRAMWGDAS